MTEPIEPAKLVKLSSNHWRTPEGDVEVYSRTSSHPPMIRGGGGVKTVMYNAAATADQSPVAKANSFYGVQCGIARWRVEQAAARAAADVEGWRALRRSLVDALQRAKELGGRPGALIDRLTEAEGEAGRGLASAERRATPIAIGDRINAGSDFLGDKVLVRVGTAYAYLAQSAGSSQESAYDLVEGRCRGVNNVRMHPDDLARIRARLPLLRAASPKRSTEGRGPAK